METNDSMLPPPALEEALEMMRRIQCTKGEGNPECRRSQRPSDREAAKMLRRRHPDPKSDPLNASPMDPALNSSGPQFWPTSWGELYRVSSCDSHNLPNSDQPGLSSLQFPGGGPATLSLGGAKGWASAEVRSIHSWAQASLPAHDRPKSGPVSSQATSLNISTRWQCCPRRGLLAGGYSNTNGTTGKRSQQNLARKNGWDDITPSLYKWAKPQSQDSRPHRKPRFRDNWCTDPNGHDERPGFQKVHGVDFKIIFAYGSKTPYVAPCLRIKWCQDPMAQLWAPWFCDWVMPMFREFIHSVKQNSACGYLPAF